MRLRLLALQRISLGEPVQAEDNMRDISPFCDEAPESGGLAEACRAAQEELEAFAAEDARLAAHLVAVRAAAHPLPEVPHASEAASAESHSLRLCMLLFSQMGGEAKLECLQTRSTARRLELVRAAIRLPGPAGGGGWLVEPSPGTVAVASATGQGSNCVIS